MAKTNASPSDEPSSSDTPHNEAVKKEASTTWKEEYNKKIREEILLLDTKIQVLGDDYEKLTEILGDIKNEPMPPSEKENWKVRAARWLVKRPQRSFKKLTPMELTDEEKIKIAKEALEIQQKMDKLITRRERLMFSLGDSERQEVEAKGKVIDIREYIKKKSAAVIELAQQTPKPAETEESKKLKETTTRYEEFIDGMHLTAEQKEKLINIIGGYEEAVATAKELDPDVIIPSKEDVIANILKLGAKKLERIAAIMEKPDLIIEPDKSLVEMVNAMDKNRHYKHDYQYQSEARLEKHCKWSGRPKKVSVSIMDMAQAPRVVPDQEPMNTETSEQFSICKKYFRKNGMQLANDRQYAAGMQKSLRAYERGNKEKEHNPGKHILDFDPYFDPYKDKPDKSAQTVTMLDEGVPGSQGSLSYDPYSYNFNRGKFSLDYNRCVDFAKYNKYSDSKEIRGRAVMKVMEIKS